MLSYILIFILIVVSITYFYIKNHLNKGEEKIEKSFNSLSNESKEEAPECKEEKISFDVRNNQNVEIDNSTKAIKKIVRRYSNINSLKVITKDETKERIEDPDEVKSHPKFENINISEGSAFDDQEMDFDIISDNDDNPPLNELKLITEIESDKGNELFKIIDTSLHDKIKNQLAQIAEGKDDDDDDIMNEFKHFRFSNSYAENTNELFNDLSGNELETESVSEENTMNNTQKHEINTVNTKKTFNFTEISEQVTDSTLDFNFDFEELEENNNN
ncbi:hypothetical protein C1631_022890 [Chryseobacterium phosphatilyticum]|uniref:Uncharacterized protein n=1 Tax=Chryseobacterium phosphatilyticum TaxID=475075 RepID=A0A316WM03_9FLAO|nr:hypothetical protein [Chryseobacterium phosphatilyticum]PWN62415.1 hypothetical protein C1631_022890 [Chryseobacterium phosphatilyticum]